MKVIKYLCNPHTLAYPSNVSPRTFQLFLFAGSSRYHHHRCRRRKGEGEWKERERGKNWSATRRLRPSWINEARAVPIRFYRFLDTTSRGGRNESASLLAACARNEKLNVSREREGRGGERERGELAKLSGGRSANFPRSFDAASCNFQRAPPTFGYYYSSTLESKRVGAQIRRLITNESEAYRRIPKGQSHCSCSATIIRGINLRKFGEIDGEKLVDRERFEGREEGNCSRHGRSGNLVVSSIDVHRDEHRIRNAHDPNTLFTRDSAMLLSRLTRDKRSNASKRELR